jgi:DNA mismatch endonuclease (patch repair protein)
MRAIKGKNTKPELVVRRLLHAAGYRYRLHRRDLPGRPDIVFPARRKVILVHGCFWHRHPGCRFAYAPKTRPDFWHAKFDRNVERDREAFAALDACGWRQLVIWECEIPDANLLMIRVAAFLEGLDEREKRPKRRVR